MARPRIFVSSTCYDLKHIRSSLEIFIETLGYESVLSEKGDIAYLPDGALDESCYREAAAADIFILIIGGRYGAEVSGSAEKDDKSFFKRYDSITRREFESAHNQDIPIFILIEKSVYAEYRTYKKNIGNNNINYAHVDSVNVFLLIDNILSLPRNNPVFDFEKSSDIENWLRDQWSGLFRELLKSRSQQKQLLALTGQISELQAVNETLKNYLEVVLKGVVPNDSSVIIEEEEKKLSDKMFIEAIKRNDWFQYLSRRLDADDAETINMIVSPNNVEDIRTMLLSDGNEGNKFRVYDTLFTSEAAQKDFNDARELAGRPKIHFSKKLEPNIGEHRRQRRSRSSDS